MNRALTFITEVRKSGVVPPQGSQGDSGLWCQSVAVNNYGFVK